MRLPSRLDFAFLLSALPPQEPQNGEPVVVEHEDFRLTLLAPAAPGMPYRPLGYLLLAWLGAEAVHRSARELGSSLARLARSLGAPELAERPALIEEQLVRLGQMLVKIELAGKKTTRTAIFPLFSELVLDASSPEAGRKWHLRLSGDFYRILKHTATSEMPKIEKI
jgi:hypothetical protein